MTTTHDISTAAGIKSGKRREAKYRYCTRGDLLGEHADLDAQLADLTRSGLTADILEPDGEVVALAERIRALEYAIRGSTQALTLRALERGDYDFLCERHQNEDGTLKVATLAPELVRMCLVDPALSPDSFDDLWDRRLTQGQRDELWAVAWAVNTEAPSVPFSERASVVTRWRAQNSSAPEPGASPEASS